MRKIITLFAMTAIAFLVYPLSLSSQNSFFSVSGCEWRSGRSSGYVFEYVLGSDCFHSGVWYTDSECERFLVFALNTMRVK